MHLLLALLLAAPPLADQMAAEQEKRFPTVNDAAASEYIDALGRGLAALAGTEISFSFRIAQAPTAFASSLPDGRVAVSVPLLRTVESEDVLAAALAHQIAHVITRRPARTEWLGAESGLCLRTTTPTPPALDRDAREQAADGLAATIMERWRAQARDTAAFDTLRARLGPPPARPTLYRR